MDQKSRNSLLFYIVQEQRCNTISFNCRGIKFADASSDKHRRNNNLSIFFLLNQNRAPNSFVSVENCIEYQRLSKNDTTGNASNRVLIEETKSVKTVKDVQVREMIV